MAESSSTSASASTSTAANSDYDVFVNHRGPDVKKTFASHLYRRLRLHGLRVFLDQPELQRGDGLTRQIEGAIRSASVHVAIFSSGYAESAWCLKELVLMQESKSPIIPVFYHTKPSDLLAIKGGYARALEDLKMKTASDPRTGEVNLRYDSNTIENWRTALSSVKEIVGFDLEACNSDEGELVDKVVEGVLRKVKKPALDVATYPTGLDDKINDFENTVLLPLQQSGKPQILGIWGLGGVGKTTLAKEFFNRKKSDYSGSCFLFDVRDYARKGTLHLVQRNLLECLTGSDHPIHSVPEGITRLQRHRSSGNALVIIDDVDREDQVDALLPQDSVLHSNSLILITSRYKNVLTGRDKNRSIYKLEGLKHPQAEELFCCYAFNQPHPLPEFKSLVNKFLKTCDGLPLSLKVFGALLNSNYEKRYWQYLLEKLEVPSDIQDKLQISFDSLTVTEKNMFLDMACFFIGEDRDMAIKIWEGSGWEGSSWNGLRDFQNIQDKCLVEVDSKNKIKMHDHLRDLGRDLAKAPGLPRRLWSWKENDIEDLLQQSWNVQVILVRGIKLVSSEYNDIHVEDALGGIRMRSLQLLDGEGVLVERILAKVPSLDLRWLRWKNCPCSSLPSSISMKNLRVLHLEGERLRTLWQNEWQAPLELRELEITSHHSNILNSVEKLKHLERIVIRTWNSIGIQKKNVLDLNCFHASIIDDISELLGRGVSFQFVSTSQIDSSNGIGKLSKNALLQNWISTHEGVLTRQTTYGIEFHWDSNFGIPGAFFITNSHHHEFFLKSLTLQVPGHGNVHFDCNSWVYPASTYNRGRVFFSNRSYLPANSPPALIKLRNEELRNLRGEYDGMAETERKERDRVYDYDFYNDLGNPDKNMELSRPVLGGSQQFPYPRRGRTGRPRTKTEPTTESRLELVMSLDIYVPRDERFGHLKLSDFLAYALKSVAQFLVPELKSLFDSTPNEFDSFEDVMKLYSDGIKLPENPILDAAKNLIPLQLIKETTDGQKLLKYPLPQVISNDKFAWRKDEEFARQMLAGVDPVVIQGLKSFPPRSKLDPEMYGPQISSLTASHIEKNLDGLTVDQALEKNKLFILDHHDVFMPYVNRINALSTKIYASRTILFLKKDGTLRPVAIELSLPPSDQHRESVRKVFTPAEEGAQGALWQLAKAYVAVNDSGYHQLISHWLKTHAVTEPFVIATNRQLSVMHPVYKLLSPHFRDTMNINALARQTLINAGGILETTVFPGKYAMEISAVAYKDWRFDEQGLPADLLNRGMAVVDSSMPHGLKLMIEDYPYAVDGLEIWFAIVSWVKEYLSLYYQNDDAVKSDTELQAWWSEIRNVGHGDKKDETWWYSMENVEEVEKALTTIIWAASALHAAVNFGQYPYAGYMPDRPTISRRLIPEEGSQEFSDLVENPDLFFLGTVSNQFQTTLGIALIEILSRHSTDEVYLGQRATSEWTEDEHVTEAFERFGMKLKEIEKNITERNQDVGKLKNRSGPAQIPYTLLYPNTSDVSHQGGLTGKGIPNSVSI